ncbi:glycosyl transferase [Pedobacter sp. KBW01]|uniref:glycosyltransferase family 2 protein n=1 Tax=Pedobacter sp. KBW01 TaxID=2153364 RepID=UPI000F5B1078|nr:glycosyltransferase family 2 protein [Pedobacter sp. KBW01]RQO71495.1 glycosyl transferase [Pedobacter sp. KBW01]
MKISLITVVYNGETFLQECFNSVWGQTYPDVEYLVIDGGSKDKTLGIIAKNQARINYFVSEKDHGLYDAINKGIEKSTGDIIGILNADDMFSSPDVLTAVAKTFQSQPEIDGLYGDLNYIHPASGKIVRKWKSRNTTFKDLQQGWMPAHPTLYIKKALFEKHGGYALDLGTTADYDLMLRLLYTHQIKTAYLPMLMVNMRVGGLSNKSVYSRWLAMVNDYKSLRRNKLPYPFWVLLKKKLSKLKQF